MKRLLLAVCLCASAAQAEEFGFDVSEFERRPFELGGYLELKSERAWLNRAGSFYQLNNLKRGTLDRNTATLKLNAKYTQGIASLNLRASAEVQRDDLGNGRNERFDEAYLSLKPDPVSRSMRARSPSNGTKAMRGIRSVSSSGRRTRPIRSSPAKVSRCWRPTSSAIFPAS